LGQGREGKAGLPGSAVGRRDQNQKKGKDVARGERKRRWVPADQTYEYFSKQKFFLYRQPQNQGCEVKQKLTLIYEGESQKN